MIPRLVIALCLLLGLPGLAAARSVGLIPDPRRSGSHLADTTGRVDAGTRARVEELIAGARARGEILVVVTDSTGGSNPRAFATRLFNRLGIGSRGRNDGVLLFLALDDRKAEIVLGDGLTVSTPVTDEIMARQIVPRMKANDLAGALTGATGALVDLVLPGGPTVADRMEWSLAHDKIVSTPPSASSPPRREFAGQSSPEPSYAPWGFGLGGGVLAAVSGRVMWRRQRRRCERCRRKMVRLDERADDALLSPAERAEESVGSVDYDLWVCNDCGTHRKVGWRTLFTRFGRCRGCNARTRRSETVTLQCATEYGTGLARVTETCAHCSYVYTYANVIPRESASDSSTSSDGGSSSGRGSSGSW